MGKLLGRYAFEPGILSGVVEGLEGVTSTGALFSIVDHPQIPPPK
jgi:hypothetical protein